MTRSIRNYVESGIRAVASRGLVRIAVLRPT